MTWGTDFEYGEFSDNSGELAIQLEHKKNDPHWNDKIGRIDQIMRGAEKTTVSTYALRNKDEFISECIAESMTSKARPMSKQVVKIITGDENND